MMNETERLQTEIIQITGAQLLPESSLSIFQHKLVAYIHDLINHDFEKLVNILYRLDVSESKLKNLLASSPQTDAGLIIAQLIIERQAEKIKTRKQYRGQDTNISDEEKW
jgi:hypothetical protein